MRRLVHALMAMACLGLLSAPALAQRPINPLPPCGDFILVDAESTIFPPSQFNADPACDVESAPPPGCGGEDLVIADQATWESFWEKHTPWLPQPDVDFEDQVVVANFLGWRRTGGFGTVVTCVRYFEGLLPGQITQVRVEVLDVSPGPTCNVIQAFTNPYSIITVDRPDGLPGYPPNVTFDHNDYVINCSSGGNCQWGVCAVGGSGGNIGHTECCPAP